MKELNSKAIYKYFNNINIGDIVVLDTVNSTNTYAKELAQNGAKHNTVVIANHQTAGRGRLGREFFSPSDTGLYMSIILRPDEYSFDPAVVTIAAGVAVCRTVEEICNKQPQIKWVNDIFLGGRKICGILAEAGTNSGAIDYVIVGIGLNVSTQIFPEELDNIAGSLGHDIDRNLIAGKILDEFNRLHPICDNSELIDEYKNRSLVIGKKIDFVKDGKTYTGTATDIDSEGKLIVVLENGDTLSLKSGEISLRSKNFVK